MTFYQLQPGGGYDFIDSDGTDADGVYRAHLPAGTYKLSFSAYDNRISEWWNNAATPGRRRRRSSSAARRT